MAAKVLTKKNLDDSNKKFTAEVLYAKTNKAIPIPWVGQHIEIFLSKNETLRAQAKNSGRCRVREEALAESRCWDLTAGV